MLVFHILNAFFLDAIKFACSVMKRFQCHRSWHPIASAILENYRSTTIFEFIMPLATCFRQGVPLFFLKSKAFFREKLNLFCNFKFSQNCTHRFLRFCFQYVNTAVDDSVAVVIEKCIPTGPANKISGNAFPFLFFFFGLRWIVRVYLDDTGFTTRIKIFMESTTGI